MLSCALLFKALDDFFATAITVAYKMNAIGIAERLGRATPGDDYRRLIPLMDAVPWWLHGLWVVAGVLYLVAIVRLLGRASLAHVIVLAALSCEIAASQLGRPIVEATGIVVNPNPSIFATVVLPMILPLLVAAALWANRPAAPSLTQSR